MRLPEIPLLWLGIGSDTTLENQAGNIQLMDNRVVITGIGMITSLGGDRESTWKAVKAGKSGVGRLEGVPGIPDGLMLAATIDGYPSSNGQQRNIPLALQAAREAIADCGLNLETLDSTRFGSAIVANYGNTLSMAALQSGIDPSDVSTAWWEEFLPCATSSAVASELGLCGPRMCPTAACASGTIATLNAVRAIQDNQCDFALAGAVQTIHPVVASGFYNMRVLAQHDDPKRACRPFDKNRSGFVMGEGTAMLVLERLDHALARRAPIYAEFAGGHICCDAHHVTSLGTDSAPLHRVISETLEKAKLRPQDIAYINAHGTGTKQNDVVETRGIREAFGAAADDLCLSSTKAVLGHMLNAAGIVELAITILALRDGFAPPTVNLTEPDPECDLDCIPFVGRKQAFKNALKLSVAFGGHLAAVAVRRWEGAENRHAGNLRLRAA